MRAITTPPRAIRTSSPCSTWRMSRENCAFASWMLKVSIIQDWTKPVDQSSRCAAAPARCGLRDARFDSIEQALETKVEHLLEPQASCLKFPGGHHRREGRVARIAG